MNIHKTKGVFKTILLYLLFIIIVIIILAPIYWLVISSFKPPVEWQTDPPVLWPSKFYINTYIELLMDPNVRMSLYNSLIVTISATLLAALLGSAFAYSISKIKFKFNLNRIMLIWILVSRVIPPISIIVPYFIIIRDLGLMDTRIALIITNVYIVFPFVVWMMAGVFRGLSKEIEEASIIDGCGFFRRFVQIALPLSKTGFMVTCVFVFIWVWNEFLFAVTLTSVKARTITVLLGSFTTDKGYEWGKMMALSCISILPLLIFAIFAQRYLIKGLSFGALKE